MERSCLLNRGIRALLALFFVLTVALPVFSIFFESVTAQGFSKVFWSETVLKVAAFTLYQSVLSTGISILLGIAMGLALAFQPGWVKGLLLVPFVVPTIVAAASWVELLGRQGLFGVDLAYSLSAVIIAHVFYNAPWVAWFVTGAMESIPFRELESGRTLGASRLQQWKWIYWNHLAPAVLIGGVQVFVFCSTSFALVLILGGGPPVQTLETEIFSRIRFAGGDFTGAAACSLWLLIFTVLPTLLVFKLRAQRVLPVVAVQRSEPSRRGVGVTRRLLAVLFVLPYLVVFKGAFIALVSVRSLDVAQIVSSAVVSFQLALAVGLGCMALSALAVLAGGSRLIHVFMVLPSGISALVLGTGFFLAYCNWLDPFEGSFFAMALIQIVLFTPFAYRILWARAQGDFRKEREAAWTLGASPWSAFWKIEWLRWRGTAFGAFALVAGASIGEVAAVSLFYQESFTPLPMLLARWLGQYRFHEASLLAALIFLVAVIPVFIIASKAEGLPTQD